jgi:hypothetical protein
MIGIIIFSICVAFFPAGLCAFLPEFDVFPVPIRFGDFSVPLWRGGFDAFLFGLGAFMFNLTRLFGSVEGSEAFFGERANGF